ncbi:glycosyltransferase [uncultured Polaribacter sp.]|uniref:glycosyltransferase n=1 Tax=uncultured Polaribacter sp. TaxID=174711 RepID=UPI00260F8258|nr:glycosyltransferase [uncultured Polaribacter sp.]
MKPSRILFIIEELEDITTSAAIVNYNLCKILAKEYTNSTILTLDSISKRVKNDWSNFGELYTHPKNNIKKYQKPLMYFNKIRALIYAFIGNDFTHYNRIINIRKFLKINITNFDTIVLLSGGLGFTPHQSIINNRKFAGKNIISVYHDPFPISVYPKPYSKSNKFKEFFKIKNLQKAIALSNTVVFPSQRLFEWYLNDYKIDEKKVEIIPHAVDELSISGIIKKETNEITITHTGTLLKPRNPKCFLEIFNDLKFDNTYINFYGGINNIVYEDLKVFEGSKYINIYNYRIPYKESLEISFRSDFLLLIESNGEFNPFLPTKFVDYINTGRPIIILSPLKSEISRLVGVNYPFITTLNNKNQIKEILQNRIHNKGNVIKALSILKKIKLKFSRDEILNNYKQLI